MNEAKEDARVETSPQIYKLHRSNTVRVMETNPVLKIDVRNGHFFYL